MEQHDLAGAAVRFVESARLLHVLGAGQGVALNLVGLAAMMIQQQDLAQAARLLSVAEAQHWVAAGSWWVAADQAKYDRTVAAVQARLDAASLRCSMGGSTHDHSGAGAHCGVGLTDRCRILPML